MRVAILCDGHTLTHWQRQAVAGITDRHQLALMVARSAPAPRRQARHFAYYALNLAAIRNSQTRRVPFSSDDVQAFASHEFDPGNDGRWATLPPDTIAWLRDQRVDVVVKLALDLLRVPDSETLPIPILSYHHGDPAAYRGRPAGFHEMTDGVPTVGQVVQILSNQLDSGEVVAFAESRVVPHSYRQTLVEAYRLSPYLLPRALDALGQGRREPRAATGKNGRLPNTWAVLRLVTKMAAAAARRLAYGLLVEKQWRVATFPCPADLPLAKAIRAAERERGTWTIPKLDRRHTFHADPFFLPDGRLVVEAMSRFRGKGALLLIDGARQVALTDHARHWSYPCPVGEMILPETMEWGRPAAYRIKGQSLVKAFDLDIDAERLIDPTIHIDDEALFLFANRAEEGASVLHLWAASRLDERFEVHPASPVRLSSRGSRMAGRLYREGGQLFRVGQDWRSDYGDGVILFRVTELSLTSYAEVEAGPIAFATLRGPHTVDRRGGELLFDFYGDRLTPMAGVRRLMGRL